MSTHKILFVDDEESICISNQLQLENRGFDVEICLSGEDAVDKLEKGCPYDLVITDLRMYGLSGVDVFKKVRDKSLIFHSKSGHKESDTYNHF
ncbi:MAG: response regulator, partial [Nitrospinota bacterium]